MARTETRAVKLYKDRAAEAVSRQVLAYAKGDGITGLKLGPDHRIRWANPDVLPNDDERQRLLYAFGAYENQVYQAIPN